MLLPPFPLFLLKLSPCELRVPGVISGHLPRIRAAASVPPAFYCNSNCTGVMEHGTRLLSTGWSPDYSSHIQSELNACPQFILRVMLSAAPVYGYAQ